MRTWKHDLFVIVASVILSIIIIAVLTWRLPFDIYL